MQYLEDELRNTLQNNISDLLELIDEPTLNTLIKARGDVQFTRLKGGRDIDVAVVIAAISLCIQIIEYVNSRKAKSKDKTNLVEKIKDEVIEKSKNDNSEELLELIPYENIIVEMLNDDSSE